jgi:hypothetical protein
VPRLAYPSYLKIESDMFVRNVDSLTYILTTQKTILLTFRILGSESGDYVLGENAMCSGSTPMFRKDILLQSSGSTGNLRKKFMKKQMDYMV